MKNNMRPSRKNKISLPGQIIPLYPGHQSISFDPLTKAAEVLFPSYINKGWCVFLRNGYLGLTGYGAELKSFVPENKRKKEFIYRDYITKDGVHKTREFSPREERIVSIAFIILVGMGGEQRPKWEVKTHWTIRRNMFEDFESAWKLFKEIEQRYDPGYMLWSKLDDYDEFENY